MSEPTGTGRVKLTCDTMLGKLSRELRLLGLDVEYIRGMGGMRAYRRAKARGRVLVTRSKRLQELPEVMFLDQSGLKEQLAEVKAKIGITDGASAPTVATGPVAEPGTRCLEDNEPLEPVSREQARPSIPFFIYQIHHDFKRCPKCRRVYWPGSHTQDMAKRLPDRGGGSSSRGGRRRRRGRGSEPKSAGTSADSSGGR